MIRPMQPDDFEPLTRIIQAGYKASPKRIARYFETGTTLVYDDGAVGGFCTLKAPRQDHGHTVAGIRIYTDPARRRNGIASALWDAMLPEIRRSSAQLIDTAYRTDNYDIGDFYAKRGFKRWFTNVGMRYTGPRFPEPRLAWKQYEDRFFIDYLSLINVAFESMRRDNDIEPYIIFSDELMADSEFRREFAENAGNLYVFRDGERVVGVTEIGIDLDGNGFIDAVGVAPEYHGRGIGRQITMFAVNRLYDRGVTTVVLDTQDRNTVARHLYESIGFEPDQDVEEARLWLR